MGKNPTESNRMQGDKESRGMVAYGLFTVLHSFAAKRKLQDTEQKEEQQHPNTTKDVEMTEQKEEANNGEKVLSWWPQN